ncbi:hypothetical protein BU23DRAFT_442966, partial [Bimuria novae-zelandiae CBS 107.79]
VVFTIPRTASHLLLKLLNLPAQQTLYRHSSGQDGYMFLSAATPRFRHGLPGRPIREWTKEENGALKDALQNSFDEWLQLVETAELQGKSTFAKEHLNWMVDPLAEAPLYGYDNGDTSSATDFQANWNAMQNLKVKNEYNITCVPDAFLLQRVKPTFLIRHPALTFPSCLRTSIDSQGIPAVIDEEKINQWECTFHWSLSLYKFYTQAAADFDRRSFVDGIEYPIVLDARDLGDERLVRKYAKAVGLNSDKVQFAWEAAREEELSSIGKMERRMKSTILASSSIDKGKLDVGDLDMERLRGEWKDEFGEVLGERLVGLVNRSMEAYQTLYNVRL